MTVRTHVEDRIAVVTIDRPDVRNAVDPGTARALFDVFVAIDADDHVDVAVLTGAGGTFCSGFDLAVAASRDAAAWIERVDIPEAWDGSDPLPSPMGPCRLSMSKPVIAAIEGHAVAGGLELAVWCDLRVAADDAVLGVFCRRWGVPLIDGGTVRLPDIVGRGRATDMVLTGRPIDAGEALGMGLIDRVTPPGGTLDAARDLARSLTGFPQACLRHDLRSTRPSADDLARSLRREWRSVGVLEVEGYRGAGRFAAGAGRGGDFDG